MVTKPAFWKDRRVFVTGHTGFKGAWLCLWLNRMGAEITGYALDPPTSPSLFELAGLGRLMESHHADIRDAERLQKVIAGARPEVVFHLAAQALVRDSYQWPVDTFGINVMGTVHVLEAVRHCPSVRAVVNVTTDKCYENREWVWGYRESDRLGGHDPYAASKACAELVTAAYRESFFSPERYAGGHGVALATVRAGNVIGGGDWGRDRLIPDCARALLAGEIIRIRNPRSIRPWQHVLEPLSGYLLLARKLFEEGPRWGGAWNFGPADDDMKPVEWIVQRLCAAWPGNRGYEIDAGGHPHESHTLRLDSSLARRELGWRPRLGLEEALASIVEWTAAFKEGRDMQEVCIKQIAAYERAGSNHE